MVKYRAAGGNQIELGGELRPNHTAPCGLHRKSLGSEPCTAQGCQQCGTSDEQWMEFCCVNVHGSTSVLNMSVL